MFAATTDPPVYSRSSQLIHRSPRSAGPTTASCYHWRYSPRRDYCTVSCYYSGSDSLSLQSAILRLLSPALLADNPETHVDISRISRHLTRDRSSRIALEYVTIHPRQPPASWRLTLARTWREHSSASTSRLIARALSIIIDEE